MATKQDIARIVSVTRAAFPTWKAEINTAEIWYLMLQDLPADHLETAVLACCGEPGREFAPSIGEIRGKVVELMARASGVPSVYEAWEELLKAPHNMLVHLPPEWSEERQLWLLNQMDFRWSHPIVERVARQLGWPDSFPGDNHSVSLAQFRDAYRAAYHKDVQESAELPQVRKFVDQHRQQIATTSLAKLVKKLESK